MNKYKYSRKEIIKVIDEKSAGYDSYSINRDFLEIIKMLTSAKKEPSVVEAMRVRNTLENKALNSLKEECLHDHLCCPGDIRTVRCAYCGKSMYQEPQLPTNNYQEVEKKLKAIIQDHNADGGAMALDSWDKFTIKQLTTLFHSELDRVREETIKECLDEVKGRLNNRFGNYGNEERLEIFRGELQDIEDRLLPTPTSKDESTRS